MTKPTPRNGLLRKVGSALPKTKRKRKPTAGEMALMEHLQELRRRVVISVIAVAVGSVVGFLWYQYSVGPISSLGDILRGPYCALPAEQRASLTLDGECRLLATSPFEMFLLRMKVGALAGVVFASPIWLYQTWAFITPGLMKNERRWALSFVSAAVFLFVSGAVLAYFVVHFGLSFLVSMGDEFQVAALTGAAYFNFLLALLIIFGVSFQVPLMISGLNVAGLLSYEQLKDKRSFIIVILFIFAAVMTPGQDPFSMVVLAMALTLLVECSIQFARINDKRRKDERPEWLDLDDESASSLDEAPTPLEQQQRRSDERASRLEAPTPVQPSTLPPATPNTYSQQGTSFDDVL